MFILSWFNGPLPSSKNPHFQNEAKCTTFLVKTSFICMRMKNHFAIHIKGWALNLILIQRPGETRKWPVACIIMKKWRPNVCKKTAREACSFFLYFQLDCGAKVTAKGIDQMTPLSVAAQKGSADIMALFFKKCTYVNNRACLFENNRWLRSHLVRSFSVQVWRGGRVVKALDC